jgi:two-component system LytT family response regulator
MIRTLIVDDEKPARSRLTQCLSREPDVEIVGVARDGLEAVKQIRALGPDLVFLDVQMPSLDGFGVLRQIDCEPMPVTIFVTAYDRYAIRAFETHALDYLLKPFSDERLDCAVREARRHLALRAKTQIESAPAGPAGDPEKGIEQHNSGGYLERIALRTSGRILFLNLNDIDWIEAAGVYVQLHAGSRMYLYRSSVLHLLERLNPRDFVRVHRSAIVNTSRIVELQPRSHGDYTVVLQGGKQLTLSRAYKTGLEAWLKQSL